MAHVATIGHSNRALSDLIDALQAHGVNGVLDVRRFPASRFNPQFNRRALAAGLEEHGIAYAHEEALGGMRDPGHEGSSVNAGWGDSLFRHYADYALTAPFRAALGRLLERTATGHWAIMCAEREWRRCHRQIIADYLLVRGHEVTHVIDAWQSEAAALNANAMPQDDLTVHYPASAEQLRLSL